MTDEFDNIFDEEKPPALPVFHIAQSSTVRQVFKCESFDWSDGNRSVKNTSKIDTLLKAGWRVEMMSRVSDARTLIVFCRLVVDDPAQ
jgi:hypothetical protein